VGLFREATAAVADRLAAARRERRPDPASSSAAIQPAPASGGGARRPRLGLGSALPRWALAAALVVLVAAASLHHFGGGTDVSRYVTAETTRGTVVRTITTTGAVDPVITVLLVPRGHAPGVNQDVVEDV
jgi:hypothetical protein